MVTMTAVAKIVRITDRMNVVRLTVLGAVDCGRVSGTSVVLLIFLTLAHVERYVLILACRASSEQERVGITYSELGLQVVIRFHGC